MGRVAFVDEGEGFGELTVGVPHEGLRNSGAAFDVAVTEVLEVAESAVFEPESVAGKGLEIANQWVGPENVLEDDGFGGFTSTLAVIGEVEAVLHDFAHNKSIGLT